MTVNYTRHQQSIFSSLDQATPFTKTDTILQVRISWLNIREPKIFSYRNCVVLIKHVIVIAARFTFVQQNRRHTTEKQH
jgi:hypothetical protein